MIPKAIFDSLASNRPIDWDRAERQARDPSEAVTQEIPVITSAELMATLDRPADRIAAAMDARLQPRPAQEWPREALERLLADVAAPSLYAVAVEHIRAEESRRRDDDALDVLTPDWRERHGRRLP
jgi:hypothetical protein